MHVALQELVGMWDTWKRSFDTWEATAAPIFEKVLGNRMLIAPVGFALTAALRARALSDAMMDAWWASLRLPTRGDQERTLHVLHQLEGRLAELEDRLRAYEASER